MRARRHARVPKLGRRPGGARGRAVGAQVVFRVERVLDLGEGWGLGGWMVGGGGAFSGAGERAGARFWLSRRPLSSPPSHATHHAAVPHQRPRLQRLDGDVGQEGHLGRGGETSVVAFRLPITRPSRERETCGPPSPTPPLSSLTWRATASSFVTASKRAPTPQSPSAAGAPAAACSVATAARGSAAAAAGVVVVMGGVVLMCLLVCARAKTGRVELWWSRCLVKK